MKQPTLRDEIKLILSIRQIAHTPLGDTEILNSDPIANKLEQAIKDLLLSKLNEQREYSRAISGLPDDKITIAFANELMASAYLGCIEDIEETIEGL